MFVGITFFLIGTLTLQAQRELPDLQWLWLFPLLLAVLPVRSALIRAPAGFALGFLWALGSAWMLLQHELPRELEGQDLLIKGTIATLPISRDGRTVFVLDIQEVTFRRQIYPNFGQVKLSWYGGPPQLAPGQQWQLKVRLKRVHGFMNPGGFDYEGWSFGKGIRTRGYVVADSRNRLVGAPGLGYGMQRIRHRIGTLLDEQVRDSTVNGILKALVIGDRSGLSSSDWEIFRQTGTSHLVAISGLHIGIVGGLGFYLTLFLWRRSERLALRLAAPRAAALVAMVCGFLYAGLAGFSLPTQRALVMLCVYMGGTLLVCQIRPFRSLMLALLIVLLIDPRAGLAPGFWLSFLAVAAILSGMRWRLTGGAAIWTWGRIQWLVALGLSPVLMIWQQRLPMIGPLVNLLAVPLFSFFVIPLALVGTLGSLLWFPLGTLFFLPLQELLGRLYGLLAFAAGTSVELSVASELPLFLWVLAILGVLILLFPKGIPSRGLGVLLLLPVLTFDSSEDLPQGDFRFYLLDVGQGMAAVIQTRRNLLVYDTGPRYSQNANAGSSVLIPFLRASGFDRIDRIIVSNGDADHRGGLAAVLGQFPETEIFSGEPERIASGEAAPCGPERSWQWDGVRFELLHPRVPGGWSGNNASCVLRVSNVAGSLLITGDIESEAEQSLLACCLEKLKADLVTIPHHGSKTSSTLAFVNAVDARYALSSTGYRNRYGFPKSEVLSRWKAAGAEVLDTASSGAIRFDFFATRGVAGPVEYRKTLRRYWNNQTLSTSR